MKRIPSRFLFSSRFVPTAALLLLAAAASAQGPGGFGGPPGGGFGGPPLPPAMQAKFQAWRTWRDTHKNVAALQRTLGALGDIEQDPRTKLTKPQAKAVLAVIRKWQAKPALTDQQARLVNSQILAPLNLTQTKMITDFQGRGGFGGRPGGFGGGRPGSFGGPGGGRPGFDPASFPAPRDYNPLNPNTQPMVWARERGKQRHAQLMAALIAGTK